MRSKVIVNPNYYRDELTDIHNILKCIVEEEIYSDVANLNVNYALSKEPIPFEKKDTLDYLALEEGKPWGSLFDCAWFHLEGKVNPKLKDLFLAVDISGEALLFDKKGEPLKGFTNGSSCFDRELGEPGKVYYPLKDLMDKKGNIDLYLDAGCNDLFGNVQDNGVLKFAKVVQKNYQAEDIFYDYQVILSYLENEKNKDKEYYDIFKKMQVVRDLYWNNVEGKYQKAKALTLEILAKPSNNKMTAICVGHSHLDLAWLWPIRESKRKAIRTICNVFYLIDKYEDFHFVISQPQQIIWIEDNYPELFKKFKKYVKNGRIELVGGSFVESDVNVINEEALARQILYGQKYYLEKFGAYTKVLWLPDSFGYNASLPQIAKLGHQKYFMTTKMSFNKNHLFPYCDFSWKGIDGTEVITHMPPENTYNSGIYPKSLIHFEENANIRGEKYDEGLILYGIGDGAGGPGEDHLERLKRECSILNLPKTKTDTVENFFERLEAHKKSIPTYEGELYLENHQGTFTSQSNNKQYDRHLSLKFQMIEKILVDKSNHSYKEKLNALWKRYLLLEFHDILPGSSIQRVYKEAIIEYADIDKELDTMIQEVLPNYTKEYKRGDYVLNLNSHDVTRLYKSKDVYYKVHIPANTYVNGAEAYHKEKATFTKEVENSSLKIVFNEKGYIENIFDKKGNKEVLLNGGNRLRVFVDHGDAWNILPSYRNQDEVLMSLKSRKIEKYGEIIEVNSVYTFRKSVVEETMIIDDELITFEHHTTWNDNKFMLRTNFTPNVKATEATCDIQFGTFERSRLNVDELEKAKFEVSAQHFVDVSEKNYGVALLNNAKSGYYIKGDNLELCLLRSTHYPCVDGDIGETNYSYGLLIHRCGYAAANVDLKAFDFNTKSLLLDKKPDYVSLISYSNDDIECTCYKDKYEGEGVIIRLYERQGIATKTSLSIDKRFIHIDEVDLLEDIVKEDVGEELEFRPFEIKTLWIH